MPAKKYFSYIRVSTLRQGQTGTSLEEQRAAIQRYATRFELEIKEEFEEKETAAAQGRPVFNRMLKALRQGEAGGIIIHKIDRSARNLKDWAELGELVDRGLEIHFANESLDLHSRGGRLSADIQAVVAADFIRNLREETRKGFYGRLKQGLYPMPAPAGYVNCGQGKPKEFHPLHAKLVRQAFEMYASGHWSYQALANEMYKQGLRNRAQGKITRSGMAHLLHNPFYIGLIKIDRTGEVFPGVHKPLIPMSLFKQVEEVSQGRCGKKIIRHEFLFRKMLVCGECQTTMIGERKKSHVYYRCHPMNCSQKTMREEMIEVQFTEMLQQLKFTEQENRYLRQQMKTLYQNTVQFQEAQRKALVFQLEQVKTRLSKLTDAYIDSVLEKELYLEKKTTLLMEEASFKEQISQAETDEKKIIQKVEKFLELVNNAYLSWKSATPEEKREMVKTITSNLSVKEKKLLVKLNYPFQIVANRHGVCVGSPQRATARTILACLSEVVCFFRQNVTY